MLLLFSLIVNSPEDFLLHWCINHLERAFIYNRDVVCCQDFSLLSTLYQSTIFMGTALLNSYSSHQAENAMGFAGLVLECHICREAL